MSAWPPPNRSRKSVWKCPLHRFQRLGKQPPAVGVDPLDDLFQRRLGRRQVVVLVGERLVAGFELFELVEGFEVDVAEVVDLLPQLLDLLLHLLPLVLLFVGGVVLQFGQLDAVVLAEPVGQAVALVADFVGGQVGGVDLLFQLADPAADLLDLRRKRAALLLERLAPVDQADGLRGEGLLAEVEVGDFGLGPEDVPARRPRRRWRIRPDARGPRRWPARALARLSSNCRMRAWRFRSRSSLLANSTLISVVSRSAASAAALQPSICSAEPAETRLHLGQRRRRSAFASAGPRPGGRTAASCCCWASCSSRSSDGPLLVQLAAPLLGGGDGHAVLGQARRRSAGVRPSADRPVAAAAAICSSSLADGVLRRVDRRLQFVELRLQRPQLAPPRDQAGRRRSAARRSACRRVRAVRRQG